MKSNTYYNMNKPPDIMLCQRSQTQKTTNCKIPFKWNVQNRQNLQRQEVELSGCLELGVREDWELRFLFYFNIYSFYYLFGCVGSLLLHTGFLQLWQVGYSSLWCAGFSLRWLLLLWSTGSRCTSFSSYGTRAQQVWLAGSRAQAQQLWHTGLVAPWHVGSSQTRAQTRVPCIGRRILNHCTTREVLELGIPFFFFLRNAFICFIIYLFIYLFLAVLGLHFCARAFSSCGKRGPLFIAVRGPLLLRSTSSRRAGSVVVAHGPSCSVACGILPDQGSNPYPLHRQADSQPLHHQGSPRGFLLG